MLDIQLKIGDADVFLHDEENGRGKITISDVGEGAFTYFWGAMGEPLIKFLQSINTSYFVNKLCPKTNEFCAKDSVSNIRKYIKEDLKYDLPWYKFPSAQKEFREKLKELESCTSADHFINRCYDIADELFCFDLSSNEEREFKEIIKGFMTCEPWNFQGSKPTRQAIYLDKFHEKLKVALSKLPCA